MASDPQGFPATDVRYGADPLPLERHLPGRTARPSPPATSDRSSLIRRGADLYNNGYWWEAHEAWEVAWMETPPNSAVRHGLQALIQVANAHLKLHLGQVTAVRALVRDMEKRFDAALLHEPELEIEGLEVAPWRCDVRRYFDAVLAAAEPAFRRELYPFIRLGTSHPR